ncbi:hypothetical protein DPMN_068941 [Dreissena polymorpha]|uniref:Uncharacterized protein n=1 Tax=Dreissena polymorpha TaxID=45954 RepID=A0A9D3YY45_DREPO|nr:hypothetical protein DPMN_068941 [Dreissena polymorpha]
MAKCEYSCPPNCQLCTSTRSCSQCTDGCSMFDARGTCFSCKANYSNTNKRCECIIDLCASSPCKTCANTTFYPNGNACCPYSGNRKHALCTSETQCTHGCEDGYYGAGCEVECTSKDPICTACIGETKMTVTCTQCKSGSYSGTNGMCSPCFTACG